MQENREPRADRTGAVIVVGLVLLVAGLLIAASIADSGRPPASASPTPTHSYTPLSRYTPAPEPTHPYSNTPAPTYDYPLTTTAPSTSTSRRRDASGAQARWDSMSPTTQRMNCQDYRDMGGAWYRGVLVGAGETKEEAAAMVDVVARECG
ncbi:hypothetical protein ACWGDE_34505 [Streptomyces sp. NPDC054956]